MVEKIGKNSKDMLDDASKKDLNTVREKDNAGYARSLIEASVDPLVTISQDGKITDVNEATVKATGATRKELVGSVFSDYFTEPDKAEEGYKKVLKEGVVQDYPLTIKHKNGKLMDVLYNASTYKDSDGKVIGVFAAARDITEQKQASQYARSLIEASLDPLVTISPEGKITDVNQATIKATGATREELIGSRFSNYFTEPNKAEEGYQTVLEKGFVADYALTIKSKEGKLMDVLYNASVYKDTRGKVIGVFAAARDVTKSKQASQYARSLIEASVDPLVTISPEGKITDVNQATIQATGANREELIGSVFSDYFTEPQKAEEGYKKVLSESIVRDYPLTIKHKDGKLMDVLYNASVYKDVRGKVIGVFAAARDVTEQKQASQYARSLIEASLDPLVTISPEGKITDVNQATIDVTGVEKEQLIGSDFSFYFTEPDKARSGYQEAFKKGEVRDYLLTIRSRTGKETPVLYNASVYKDDKGKVLGVFAAAREISQSELKAAKARELQRISKKVIFKVIVARKLSSGNVKISEKDAASLNIDMVDNVTIRPTREDITKNKVTAMSITESRLPKGIVLVGVADARKLGVEENDTAFVTKAGTEEEVELVDVESYAAKPGEYDSANVPNNDTANEGGIKPASSTDLPLKEPDGENESSAGKSVVGDGSREEAEKEKVLREKGEEMATEVKNDAQESPNGQKASLDGQEASPDVQKASPDVQKKSVPDVLSSEKVVNDSKPLAKGTVKEGQVVVDKTVENPVQDVVAQEQNKEVVEGVEGVEVESTNKTVKEPEHSKSSDPVSLEPVISEPVVSESTESNEEPNSQEQSQEQSKGQVVEGTTSEETAPEKTSAEKSISEDTSQKTSQDKPDEEVTKKESTSEEKITSKKDKLESKKKKKSAKQSSEHKSEKSDDKAKKDFEDQIDALRG
jgi:PAS domain S-box-containing protein